MALLIRDSLFLQHDTGRHPECAARLETVHRLLDEENVADGWDAQTSVAVSMDVLRRVHPAGYIDSIRDVAAHGGGRVDADTVVSPRSYEVALHAAGAAVQATDAALSGTHRVALGLVRPPGHHALANRAMGFCLFANAAIAARHALETHGLSRVLVVDWDVHHGNGTQDLFYDSPNGYVFSAHRWPFYPGTGASDETGTGAGLGTTFNLPLEFGLSRREYRERFHTMLCDAATRCRPELVILSAGFDAHSADPVGSLGLESEDFTDLTQLVRDVASQHCGGRIVSLLEGGYNVDALAESVACHMRALVETSP